MCGRAGGSGVFKGGCAPVAMTPFLVLGCGTVPDASKQLLNCTGREVLMLGLFLLEVPLVMPGLGLLLTVLCRNGADGVIDKLSRAGSTRRGSAQLFGSLGLSGHGSR